MKEQKRGNNRTQKESKRAKKSEKSKKRAKNRAKIRAKKILNEQTANISGYIQGSKMETTSLFQKEMENKIRGNFQLKKQIRGK